MPKKKQQAIDLTRDTAGLIIHQLGYTVEVITRPVQAQEAVSRLMGKGYHRLGLDIETAAVTAWSHDPQAGLDPHRARIRLLQIATPDKEALVFDLDQVHIEILSPLFTVPVIAHNAQFESQFLQSVGIIPRQIHCTQLLHQIATGRTKISLADAAKEVFSLAINKGLQLSDWSTPELTPAQVHYAALDAVLALELAEAYREPITTSRQAEHAVAVYFQTYPGVKAWQDKTRRLGYETPVVTTRSGLRRSCLKHGIDDDGNPYSYFSKQEACNTPVQGSCAEVSARSLVRLQDRLSALDAELVHHVHDEILLLVPDGAVNDAKAVLEQSMIEGFLDIFPEGSTVGLVEAGIGQTWADAKA